MGVAIVANGKRVLLVEEPAAAAALEGHLRALGYATDVANDSATALQLALGLRYDVVLATMGLEDLALLMQEAQPGRPLQQCCFLLTSHDGQLADHNPWGLESRLIALLRKPISFAELERSLGEASQVAASRQSLAAGSSPGSINVLVVEDSDSDAALLRFALETLGGYQVAFASRLQDALVRLHEDTFDTIITDLSLPDSKGLGTVIRIRESAPDATLLVCSGVADDALALRVIELGAQDVLAKDDYTPEAVSRALRFARVRRAAERRLALLARIDPMTGLYNRHAFVEQLQQALTQARRLSTELGVLYLDLDGFKPVNDRHGHEAGDAVLQQVALRLRRSVREYDVSARLGGDEFGVLVTNVRGNALELASARIAAAIAEPIQWRGNGLRVGASIGVARFPSHGDNATTLLRCADEAMYAAKRGGGAQHARR